MRGTTSLKVNFGLHCHKLIEVKRNKKHLFESSDVPANNNQKLDSGSDEKYIM